MNKINEEKQKFYKTSWFMWVTLVFFAPLGIFLLWKYRDFGKKSKVIISAVFSVFFILMYITTSISTKEAQKQATLQAQQTAIQQQKDAARAIQSAKDDKSVADAKAAQQAQQQAQQQAEAQKVADAKAQADKVAADAEKNKLATDILYYSEVSVKKLHMTCSYVGVQDVTDKGNIMITIKVPESWSPSDMGLTASMDCIQIFKLFKGRTDYQDITCQVQATKTDVKGNNSDDVVMYYTITKDTIQTTNWDNVLAQNLKPLSSEYYINNQFQFK